MLVTGEFYHIFNRGVAKAPTFLEKRDYNQAISSLSHYVFTKPPMKFSRFKELSVNERYKIIKRMEKQNKLSEIICYVLMPNHFHLLLKQTAENGISTFLSRFTNSYTKYFNTKHERVGPLFQGVFKSVHIDTTEQLIHLSRYIHLNPLTSYLVKEKTLLSYSWSSLTDYLKGNSSLINSKYILSHFGSVRQYLEFVINNRDYQRKLKQIEHLVIES